MKRCPFSLTDNTTKPDWRCEGPSALLVGTGGVENCTNHALRGARNTTKASWR